jgi:hypothetical protein
MSKATSGRRSVLSRTGGVRLLLFAGVLGATVLVAAGPSSAATPTITVKPAKGLTKGQTVTVSGKGFTPGDSVFVVECLATTTGETGCDVSTATAAKISATGALPATKFKVVTGKVGSGKCGTKASNLKKCDIDVGNASGKDSATAPVVFKKP